jgi:hypothetical protein
MGRVLAEARILLGAAERRRHATTCRARVARAAMTVDIPDICVCYVCMYVCMYVRRMLQAALTVRNKRGRRE